MVRPSAGVLSPWKVFTSRIHPPLPRSRREAEELLEAMTTSFRQNLDEHHPPVKVRRSTRSVEEPRPLPTDNHLAPILNHPLFNNVRSSDPHGRSGPPLPRKPKPEPKSKAPLDVLRDAMARGAANPETLLRCLKADLSVRSSEVNVAERLRTSGVAETIVSWFAAASTEQRRVAFHNKHLMAVVMPYMVSSRLHTDVVSWSEPLWDLSPTSESSDTFLDTCLLNMVFEFIAAEITYGGGINSALKLYVELCRLASSSGMTRRSRHALRRSNFYLMQWISVHEVRLRKTPIPSKLYDEFGSFFKELQCPALYESMFPIYHPTSPEPDAALAYFREYHDIQGASETHRGRLLRVSLKAAELCLQTGRVADAQWLLAYAKQFLPEYSERVQSAEDRSSEAVSVGVLDQLLPAAS